MAIDLAATRANIIKKYGNLKKFHKTTRFEYETIIRFLNKGIGPVTANQPDSITQHIARWLRSDGLLAESDE